MICISIGNKTLIPLVNRLLPPFVELRYDLLKEEPGEIDELLDSRISRIATCRPGFFSDSERISILKKSLAGGADLVDVEIESSPDFKKEIRIACSKHAKQFVVSYHNFEGTPDADALLDITEECYLTGADVCKIACMVHSREDAARLLSLYNDPRKKVVLGMGEAGRITRIASVQLGAPFTFVAVNEEEITAPGQFTYDEMSSILNIIQKS